MSARKSGAARPNPLAGLDTVFEAIDALTFREHRQLAELLSLQAEGRKLETRDDFADLLADAGESYLEPEEA